MEQRDMALTDAMDIWLRDQKQRSIKAASYDRLLVSQKMLGRYALARERVMDICQDDIQGYLNQLYEDGYAPTTIKKQYSLVTGYLKHAYARGQITQPVYLDVTLPMRSAKKVRDLDTYSEYEQRKLLDEFLTLRSRVYGIGVLMLEAGMRVGEACALKWDDILWERRALRVRRTLVRLTSQKGATYIQDSPKSDSSNRTIPLSERALTVLRKLENGSEYIFPAITYDSVRWHLRKACELAGIEYKGCHVFRHTFATNCYRRGCDVKILSKLLGHADVVITYNIYIHLYGDALEEMRKVIG